MGRQWEWRWVQTTLTNRLEQMLAHQKGNLLEKVLAPGLENRMVRSSAPLLETMLARKRVQESP